jgi:mono/diheme cytochrome c family protein
MRHRRVISSLVVIATSALIGAGISFPIRGSFAQGETTGVVKQHTPQPKTSIPEIPSFAMRSRIPAAGKQGPPAKAAALIGDWKKGASLYAKNCRPCHGPRGTGTVPNPGSSDGTVPPLSPIDPALADKNRAVFAVNIDRIIQHGSIPDGSNPTLFMPNWGDSKKLSQQNIADLEAYIMHVNGADQKK